MQHSVAAPAARAKAAFRPRSPSRSAPIGDTGIGGWYLPRSKKRGAVKLRSALRFHRMGRWREAFASPWHPAPCIPRDSIRRQERPETVREPDVAVGEMLAVIDGPHSEESGGFLDYPAERTCPW